MPIQFKNSEIIKQKKKKRKQILGYFLLEIWGESLWMKRLRYYKIYFERNTFISVSQSIRDNL